MLSLTNVPAAIRQVQPRVERHGDEGAGALDVAMGFKLIDRDDARAFLTAFGLARDLDVLHHGDGTPAFPELEPRRVRHKLLDVSLRFHQGRAAVTVRGDLKKVRYDALPGGGLDVHARLNVPTECHGADIEKLCDMWADGGCKLDLNENQAQLPVGDNDEDDDDESNA